MTREQLAAYMLAAFERVAAGGNAPWVSRSVLDGTPHVTLDGDFDLDAIAGDILDQASPPADDGDDEDDPNPRCTNPSGHEWAYSGTAYGGDDPSYFGEGRCYCVHCGADGDA